MQKAGKQIEARDVPDHCNVPALRFAMALGGLGSPERRLKDSE
jgi:hypothetical protein